MPRVLPVVLLLAAPLAAAQIPAELAAEPRVAEADPAPREDLDRVELAELRRSDPSQAGGDMMITIGVIFVFFAVLIWRNPGP